MEWIFRPAHELAGLIKAKKISPVELTGTFLQRIEKFNPRLNAYLAVMAEEAMGAARRAEEALYRREDVGPLHGIPVSVKDLYPVRGVRLTFGSLPYRDFTAEEDAIFVERLKAAGAVVLGKTNTSEFGQSATTENRLGAPCRNPWNLERTSGGSSGGAAAGMAAGLACLAQGSDGGGSIRIPSSFCGVYGLKPSFGRVAHKSGPSGMPLFSHIGPITRCVRDAALMLNVIAGPDASDHLCLKKQPPDFLAEMERPRPQWRIAWSPDLGYAAVDPEVRSLAYSALSVFEEAGHTVEEAKPQTDSPFEIFGPIVLGDTFAAHGSLLENQDLLTNYMQRTLVAGSRLTGGEYAQALRLLFKFRAEMAEFFSRYDLLFTPGTAVPAFPIGRRPKEIAGQKVSTLWGPFPFTVPWNLTGQPAASVPCGFSADGLPVSLQIIGRMEDEGTVLQASALLEQARPWAEKIPEAFRD